MRARFALLLPLFACATPAREASHHRSRFTPGAALKVLLVSLEQRGGEPGLAAREEELVVSEIIYSVGHSEVLRERDLFAVSPDADKEKAFRADRSSAALRAAGKEVGADWVLIGWVGKAGAAASSATSPHVCDLAALSVTSGRFERRAACVNSAGPPRFDQAVRRAAAQLFATDPEVAGPATSGDVVRLLEARRGHFQHCYAEALIQSPQLQGRAMLNLAIDPSGRASSARMEGLVTAGTSFSRCVEAEAKALPYPKVQAEIEYPLAFSPES
jgi:hypothetical protein